MTRSSFSIRITTDEANLRLALATELKFTVIYTSCRCLSGISPSVHPLPLSRGYKSQHDGQANRTTVSQLNPLNPWLKTFTWLTYLSYIGNRTTLKGTRWVAFRAALKNRQKSGGRRKKPPLVVNLRDISYCVLVSVAESPSVKCKEQERFRRPSKWRHFACKKQIKLPRNVYFPRMT